MEIFTCIGGLIGEAVAGSITRPCGYLRRYNNNIMELEAHLQSLKVMEDGVSEAIEAAKRNRQVIREVVQRWIESVNRVIVGATEFLEEHVKAEKRCFRCFPAPKTRYWLSRAAVNILSEIKMLLDAGEILAGNVSWPAPPPGLESVPSRCIILFQTTKLAMEKVMDALEDDSIHVVGIHGMGGVGKTTLVKEIGRKSKVDGLFDVVAMAVVSQSVDVIRIQQQIAESLGLKLEEEDVMIRANRLRNILKNVEKILVILDDLWGNIDLTDFGIPSMEEHKGCKVVITTRRKHVCFSMGRGDQDTSIIPLDVLTKHESLELFKMQVGNVIQSPAMETMAKTIVKETGGLPIALLTVGKALRGKDEEEWKAAAQELQRLNFAIIDEMEETVFKCIKFSYDYLKHEEARYYFLLCSLYPGDDDIPIEHLVRYGVGRGIFQKADKIQEVRTRVRSIIRNLEASSLLVASEEEGCIKMHNIVRGFARKITSNEYIGKAGEGLKEWPNELTMGEYNGVGISVMRNKIEKYPDTWECPNLDILLMQDNRVEQQMPEEVFKGMKTLRVLHQSQGSIDRRLEPFFCYLTNLRTLIIDGLKFYMGGQFCFPSMSNIDALGELKMLEILSFTDFVFSEPLDVLRKLSNLRLLELGRCKNLSSLFNYTSAEHATLTRLEELYIVNECRMSYEEDYQLIFARLNCFPRLTALQLQVHDIRCLPKDFVFPKLDRFHITIGTRRDYDQFNDQWSPNFLFLAGLDVPNFCVELLSSVNYLDLVKCDELRCIVPHIMVAEDSLEMVDNLHVEDCDELEYLINDEESQIHGRLTCFSNIKTLELYSLGNFKGICYGKRLLLDMPWSFLKLEYLSISACSRMSNIGISFNLLQRMKKLRHLGIRACDKLEYLLVLEEDDAAAQEQVLGNLIFLDLERLPCLEHLWKGFTGSLNLRSLQAVIISGCNELRILFQWSVARSLVQLEHLLVYDCGKLTGICTDEAGEETVDDKMLPELKTLWLSQLPKLIGFYVGNTPLNGTPMLEYIMMGGAMIPLNGGNLNTIIEDNRELLLHRVSVESFIERKKFALQRKYGNRPVAVK